MTDDVVNSLLPLLNTVLEPVRTQLAAMSGKIDRALALGEKVATAEAADARHDARLDDVEKIQAAHAAELAEIRGRNKVILGILITLVAPVVVALMLAGLSALFKIKVGG